MRIKAVCRVHPSADVLFLEGTVSMRNTVGEVQGDDSLENVVEVHIDEGNLYCTVDEPFNHDMYFEIHIDTVDGEGNVTGTKEYTIE